MGVKKATGFLTSDGRFFGPQSEAEANEHELLVRLRMFCRGLDYPREPSEEDLAKLLFGHREQLLRILNGLDEPTMRPVTDADLTGAPK